MSAAQKPQTPRNLGGLATKFRASVSRAKGSDCRSGLDPAFLMRSKRVAGHHVREGHQREHAMIYLLRHGQTEFNLEGRYQGQSDSPLTDRGRAQARAYGALLAEHVGAAAIWTSPLPRALETARLVAKALPSAELHLDDRLHEVSFGVWEGMTRADIAAGWPNVRRQHPPRQWKLFAPEGEGIEPLLARLQAVLRDAAALRRDLILVGHGVAGRLIRGLHAGLPLTEALTLDAPQDVVYRLHENGEVDQLPCAQH